MATELLSLFAKIGIDDKEFNSGVDKAEGRGSKFAKALGGGFKVAAAGVAVATGAVIGLSKSLYSGVKATAEYGDNVDKMSQKMGISSKAYQEWDAVLQHSGTSIEALKPSMKVLAVQAEKGSDAFQKLGISQEEVASLSQEELFARTIEGLQNMEEGTERTALTSQLLGRGAVELGALLNTSAEDTQKMKDRVNELNGVMSEDAVKAAAAFQDQLQDMSTSFDGLKRKLTGEFLPSVTLVMEGLTDIFAGDTEQGTEKLSKGIEDVVAQTTKVLPQVLKIGGKIITSIVSSISQSLPQLATSAAEILTSLSTALIENLPLILSAGIEFINTLMGSLLSEENIETLITTVIELITMLGDLVIENLPLVLSAGLQIIVALMQGLTESLPAMMPTIVTMISTIVSMLTQPDMLQLMITGALQLITALAQGLIQNLPTLLGQLPFIISNLVNALIALAPQLIPVALELLTTLGDGLVESVDTLLTSVGEVGQDLLDEIDSWIDDALTWGGDLIDNFVQGIRDAFSSITQVLNDLGELVADLIGFSLPEKGPLSHADEWMPDMMDLMAGGIKSNKFKVLGEVRNLADDMNVGVNQSVKYTRRNERKIKLTVDGDGNDFARALSKHIKLVDVEEGDMGVVYA